MPLAGQLAQQERRDLQRQLDNFLAEQERRAYQMAYLATHDREEALEIVQDAMFKLVQKYAHKPAAAWGPLFTRILQTVLKTGTVNVLSVNEYFPGLARLMNK